MEFTDKVVLITGASKGIGAAAAELFAQRGAKVVINYRSSDDAAKDVLNKVQKYSDGMLAKCDVTKEKDVERMVEEIMSTYSHIDILVNNVGGYIDGDEWNGPSEVWEQSLKLNVLSTLNVSKYVAAEFIKAESGVIVNIASRYAQMGSYDSITYAASKAAILSITKAYSKLLSPFGRANSVSPGATDSGYWKIAPADELKSVIANSPHKRLIKPMEIAEVILFMASDKAKMITGQDILTDGGK